MGNFKRCFINTFLVYNRHLTAALLVLIFHSPVSAGECPDVSGSWQRAIDNFTLSLEHDGCRIFSTSASSGGFDHKLKGKWNPRDERFNFVMVRRNVSNGCVTEMYGHIIAITDDRIRSTIYGSDGRCDLQMGYGETYVYERR
jgi:hypothetical protein